MSSLLRTMALLVMLVMVIAACDDGGSDDAAADVDDADLGEDADLAGAEDLPVDEDDGDADDDADTEVADADDNGGADDDDTPEADTSDGSLLDEVRDRGTLICGANDAVPGFGVTDADGEFTGFDIDFCRVIAAGVLGDADAVEFRPLTAEQRFTALQSGEIDVMVRNTTWSAARDGSEGGQFTATTFYDGQGMMVRADSGIESVEDMEGTAVCVLSGTTTEMNLATRFAVAGVDYEPVPFEDNETLQAAFEQERCDGWTSDLSQLAGIRSVYPEGPESLEILDDVFSKEPLGPSVLQGDDTWFDAVQWSVLVTIQAEEFGITSENIDDFLDDDNPDVRRLLGQPEEEGDPVFDPGLGLEPDFAYEIITQVGNYGEIYEANVGPDTDLGLERGLNDLWTEGGLLYAPPYR